MWSTPQATRRFPAALYMIALLAAACAGPRFEVPRASRPMVIPDDHSMHPEFKTEWWYWNGHLATEGGDRYDFILSFTRHDTRGDRWYGLPLLLLPRQSYIGMFAITDRRRGTYSARTKVNVPDFWAAGADTESMRVWHDSWRARWDGDGFHIVARIRDRELDLRLVPEKPAAIYGTGGFVDVPGAPHYVYSYTRIRVEGTLADGGSRQALSGIAWFDHFIGHTQSSHYRAWDWLSVQLDDGYDYMFAQLRAPDGGTLAYANFEVAPDGTVARLPDGEPRWTLRRTWPSGRSDAVYRLGWTIAAPGLILDVNPVIDDQEFHDPPIQRFWEGAVSVRGRHNGVSVTGEGYLETVAEGGLPLDGLRFGGS